MKKKTKVISILTAGLGLSILVGGSVAGGILANQSATSTTIANNKNTLENISTTTPVENIETPNVTQKPNGDVNNTITSKPVENKPSIETSKPTTPIKPDQNTTTQQSGKLFSKILARSETSGNSSSAPEVAPNYKMPERITRQFKHGMLKDQEQLFLGSPRGQADKWQSDLYFNQRDFMPILDSYDLFYSNERGAAEVDNNFYNGWEQQITSKWLNGGAIQTTYKALPQLMTKEGPNRSPLQKDTINALTFDVASIREQSSNKNDDISKKLNDYMNEAVKKGFEFFIFEDLTQSELEQIKIPENTKKLTIKDLKGQLSSLKGISIPSTVQELEFYSTTASKIDPTILSSNTHVIYDHADGDYVTAGSIRLQPFKTIDLSNRADLTNSDVQKALDAVYGERQYERSFHGDMVGGYIYQLDLSNTPIKSLNNVYIPSQTDGRFNIAYVQWTSGVNSHGSVTITIGGNNKYPNNDSQVNEWFDASGWAEKATKIMLNSEGEMTIESILPEVKSLFKKYPNVNTLDLTGIDLKQGQTHKELSDKIIEIWNQMHNENGESSVPTLNIIHKQSNELNK